MVLLAITALLLFCTFANARRPKAETPRLKVCDLRTERMTDPMSIDTPTPRLGWRIESSMQGVLQTSCRIIVASTREKAEALEGDLWDATLDGDKSQWVRYEGKPLRSNTRCYWRVKVQLSVESSEPSTLNSEWSDVAMWNVGLLTESDWRGQWIGYDHTSPWDKEEEHSRLSSRYLRTEFELNKKVRQATLYICGLGLYECFINGQRIGDQMLAPMPTDYRRTVLYNAYDVTSLLRVKSLELRDVSSSDETSDNSIAVVLGNGRYYTMQQNKKPHKITRFGYPTLRANLIVEFEDGSRKVIATDEKTWKVNVDGALRSNNEYDGEIYDARKEFTGWTMPGFDDSKWMKAERTAIPYGTLRGQMSPGMKVVQTLKPKSVTRKGDKIIVDMGQNMAGWLNVRIGADASERHLSEGDSIIIRYAEKLDSTGNIWTENLRHAESTDRYYANGRETADTWWHPVFSYHGFRYAEITGLYSDSQMANGKSIDCQFTTDDFIGEVVSDAMEETGHFVCNDTILNKVYQNARWGILSNYKGMPVDCPQRDERQPWLGDRTRGCFGEAFLFDNQTLYAKWARDICEAQREDGCIPDVAPAYWNYYSDDLTWAAALPMVLRMLSGHYGDMETLFKFYPNVKRWLEHIKDCYQKDGLIHCGKYADWCVPPEREDLIHSEDPARKTDVTLISSAYYYYICKMMEKLSSPTPDPSRKGEGSIYSQERICNNGQLQEVTTPLPPAGGAGGGAWFSREAALTKEAFNRTFLTVKKGTAKVSGHILYPDSTYYGNNTVTANVLPYTFGMIDDPYVKEQVEKQIIKALVDQGAITTGVIGTGWLLHALTDMGRTDLAWLLATNKQYPSWGYMAERGATTIWELWNGDTASPKMNSGNHVMLLGDLLSWLYEDIAGIRAAGAGFKHIAMQPDFSVDEIDDIDASYQSIYGRIVSRWKKDHEKLFWHVEIPANTRATLRMPDGTVKEVGSGVHELVLAVPQKTYGTYETYESHETYETYETHKAHEAHRPYKPQILCDEFLYKDAPFPSCHSATIVETQKGDLVATYFGGTKERNPDVCIWVSRKPKGAKDWTAPVMVADGVEPQPLTPANIDSDGRVLTKVPEEANASQVSTPAKPFFNAQFQPLPQWTGNFGAMNISGLSSSSPPPHSPFTPPSLPSYYREACWNPVLFETPDGVQHLYFKIGPNVAGWKGWRITSKDGGRTWSRREQLPDSIYGPIKNKPFLLRVEGSELRDITPADVKIAETNSVSSSTARVKSLNPQPSTLNRLISPTSDERDGWKCYFELSDDYGKTWRRTAFVEADSGVLAIQPTIIQLPDGRLEALCRTRNRHIGVTFSSDYGETWSKLQLIDTPNNNSGIDAVTLTLSETSLSLPSHSPFTSPSLPFSYALICNDWPIEPDKQKGARTPLSILRSDDGLHWQHWVTLEDSPISQYSYPSIIQTRDGHLHAIYTWRRQRIKHVELVP